MKLFMEELDTQSMSGATEHAVENLSLMFAGGCMAIDAGILDYAKRDRLRAIERCFRDAVDTAGEERDPLLRAKSILRRRLGGSRIFRLKSPNASFASDDFS